MAIRIFVTGGTFDKEHDPISEKFIFTETHIPELLRRSRSLLDIKVRTIMLIDSLDMTKSDQEIILQACENSKEDQILITHGTSKMEETAKFLGERINDKTIVLVGAMVPYTFTNLSPIQMLYLISERRLRLRKLCPTVFM